MGYIAKLPLRFGDRTLSIGDEVPVEDGRDYHMMERTGQVIFVPDGGSQPKQRAAAGDGSSKPQKRAAGKRAKTKAKAPVAKDPVADATGEKAAGPADHGSTASETGSVPANEGSDAQASGPPENGS